MPEGVFHAVVLTPEAVLLEGPARAVVLRSSDGDLTVLDGHTPLVTDVVPGPVRVEPDDGEPQHLAVHGGYLQVETTPGGADGSTRVTLLTGVAERAGDIDVARAERARDEARARLEQLEGAGGAQAGTESRELPGAAASPEEVELAETRAALRRAEVRLEVAGDESRAAA